MSETVRTCMLCKSRPADYATWFVVISDVPGRPTSRGWWCGSCVGGLHGRMEPIELTEAEHRSLVSKIHPNTERSWARRRAAAELREP